MSTLDTNSHPSTSTMDCPNTSISTNVSEDIDDQQTDVAVLDDSESAPPLLHPHPSRISSCLRAPCLKRNAGVDAIGSSPLLGSGSSSPRLSASPQEVPPIHAFSGIKVLCPAVRKRHVHFDAAPPEAGLTHSGDNYDRRPIECTQGGSQMDLSLPPRGTCPRYSEDADDEACDEEGEDEDSKQERLRGFARWARLKNGGSMMGGAIGLKFASNSVKKNTEETAEISNVCSVPVHGIRSFGGLAGKSCLTSSNSTQSEEEEEDDIADVGVEEGSGGAIYNADEDDDESEDRQEAFRKAVYAALSKDPNATPMPSPSVRPRWECITSYFEPSDKGAANEEETSITVGESLSIALGKDEATDYSSYSPDRNPLSREQEACKVATWTQDQAANIKDMNTPLVVPKAAFALSLPPPKTSPSISVEGSSVTHPSSSPMSSRGSSSDAWSSGCGGGIWSGSEQDAFDVAFSKIVTMHSPLVDQETATPKFELFTSMKSDSNEDVVSITHAKVSSLDSQSGETEGSQQEIDHEQAASSSSSGGGPGWLSSCCTSPEMAALDMDQSTTIDGTMNKAFLATSSSMKAALIQKLAPLDLQKHYHHSISPDQSPQRFKTLLDHSGIRETVSSPTSGDSSPRILSTDEEEISRKSSCLFRCSSKKTRKARRTASGDGRREEISPDVESNRPGMMSRSKSMSAASSTRRLAGLVKKSSAFTGGLDDEGALGGF